VFAAIAHDVFPSEVWFIFAFKYLAVFFGVCAGLAYLIVWWEEDGQDDGPASVCA